MGLKLLHSADWHLDSPFASFSPADGAYLRRCSRRIPGEVAQVCRREGCEVMLLSGDLFDGSYTQESLTEVREALKYAGVPVFISPGNHDYVGEKSPWTAEAWPENVHIFTGGLESVDVPELDLRVWGAGYRSMDCPPLLEDFHAGEGPKYQVAVLHGDAGASASPYCPVTAAQVKQSGLNYLALGHIHRADGFQAGKTLCAWPGCPMGRGWDETGSKGVLKVTLDQKVHLSPIQLGLPRFFAESVSVDEGLEALDRLLPSAKSQDFYRITLTGRGEADISALLKKYGGPAYLEFRNRTKPKRELWDCIGEDSFQGVFFDLLHGALEQADPQDAETIRLAAELSRRILDGEEVELP